MEQEKEIKFPMTYMETQLKKFFLTQPDLAKHIQTPTEHANYLSTLIQTQGKKFEAVGDITSDPELSHNAYLTTLTQRLTQNPNDTQALNAITTECENQKEEHYVLASHDISVGHMFRYMPAHWHTNDYFEIYYCFSGNCPIYFVDETISLTPGDVLIIAPQVLHASPCYEDDCVLLYYILRSSTFDKVFWNQLPPENLMTSFFHQALEHKKHAAYLQFETGTDADIRQLLFRVYDEFFQEGAYGAQMMNALISTFFILLLRRYEGTAKLPRTDGFYWKQEFSAIFSYIQSHYLDQPLSEIAKQFHYSERQITRIVYNCIGISYAQLILKLKMEKAASLLKQQLPIKTVSLAVGYSATSSFYHAFTQYFNCTPAEYRETQES